MKNVERILICFSLIARAMKNPPTLYSQSLKSLKYSCFGEDGVRIINRFYPNYFNVETTKDYSRLLNSIYSLEFPGEEIDLSDLGLETLPNNITKRMKHVKKLNLSNNKNLKLNEEWASYFYDNLKELSLRNCNNITDEILKSIAKMNSLESLNLSENNKFDIKILTPILYNLKHLDVSSSGLTSSEFEHILSCAVKLQSLNFSGNRMANQISFLTILSKRPNLKILKLSKCGLRLKDLENIIQVKSLEEVDLSKNYLNLQEQKQSFTFESKQENFDLDSTSNLLHFAGSIENNNNKSSPETNSKTRLKKINLSFCNLANEKFIKSLFEIEGLEVLNLQNSILDFDMKEILNCKAKDSLKELNVRFCKIKSSNTFRYLTDFTVLEKLDISDNQCHDFSSDFRFGQSKYSLRDLSIAHSTLNIYIFKSIAKCTCLEKLDLCRSNFEKVSPSDLNFDNLKNTLKELNIRECLSMYNWSKFFTNFPKLQKIECSRNGFLLFGN